MNNLFLSSVIILLLSASFSLSQENTNNKEQMNLIETEYAFVEETKNSTVRDGFLKYIAEEGILFRPNPVNGKEFLTNSEAKPGLLLWYPNYSIVSSSGEMGVNTGPWEFKQNENDESIAFGQFVTVWEKQSDDTWKFLIDLGISHPKLETAEEAKINSIVVNVPSDHVQLEYRDIISIEENFANDIAKNHYLKFADNSTIILRNNRFPIIDEEVKEFISTLNANIKWETFGGKASINNDLAFTYGKGSALDDKFQTVYEFYYLHVWVIENNQWKLLADVVNEIEEIE